MITVLQRSPVDTESGFEPQRGRCAASETATRESSDADWRSPFDEPDEPGELDDPPPISPDDDRWDVFLPDDDPYEPRPEPGDFWIDVEEEEVTNDE